MWTQNECLGNPEIKRLLGLGRPENIVRVSESVLWVIEAKSSPNHIAAAKSDAYGRATKLNISERFKVMFISGVAGNNTDGFVVQTEYCRNGEFRPITWNDAPVTSLLRHSDLRQVLEHDNPDVETPKIDEALFLSRANAINEELHLGAVNPHQRASVMAALLLSMLADTDPNIGERSPSILIADINSRVKSILVEQGKPEFYDYIRISLPTTPDNHLKFRRALVNTIQELHNLNIKSAMNSGDDWLGTFYEVFLKYASWAQDLGIVLTPRHITRWAADVMDIRSNDIVYDPTCGTGGFLVAAFDYVKRQKVESQIRRFKQHCLYGVEQESSLVALAVVNMIFMGDGKNNIKEGNCFSQFLHPNHATGVRSARFGDQQSSEPPVTKVMMNPPFSLKHGEEKEYKFINQALDQMEDGGILFSVLPYSTMCKPQGYDHWRKTSLMSHHTLLSVVSFPIDVFYPIGVTTVGIFIRKGTPHPKEQGVLWIRATSDGLLKTKGKRLPNPGTGDALGDAAPVLKAFIQDQSNPVSNALQFYKVAPINRNDPQLELVPEAYLDQAQPDPEALFATLESDLRHLLAYLITLDRIDLQSVNQPTRKLFGDTKWRTFAITDVFDLKRGHFHSLKNLDDGDCPTISRVSTNNGCIGLREIPEGVSIWPPGTITVSTVTGDVFLQPVPFIATDNIVLCVLREECKHFEIATLAFIQAMMNHIKWRYSYGRQCYKTKYAKTEIWLPINPDGSINECYMNNMVKQAKCWEIVESAFVSGDPP